MLVYRFFGVVLVLFYIEFYSVYFILEEWGDNYNLKYLSKRILNVKREIR